MKWDRTTNWLRYDNQWYYLLSGEILETSDIGTMPQLRDATLIDFVFVDILMKLEKSNVLYSGILAGYELAGDGGLRTLYLSGARRKQLTSYDEIENLAVDAKESTTSKPEEDIRTEKDSYYSVDGHLMVIPYSQMLNLNLTYYIDEDDAQQEGDVPMEANEEFEVNAVDSGDLQG